MSRWDELVADSLHDVKLRAMIDTLLDVSGIIVLGIDREQGVVHTSRTFCELIGVSTEDVTEKDCFEKTIPEAARRDILSFAEKMLTGDVSEDESFIITFTMQDGKKHVIKWSGKTVLEPPNSEALGVILIGIDLTEQKAVENALRESEKKHRTLFETMEQGVVYQDVEGKVVSVNPAAERILGLSMEQMLGRESVDPRWKSVREDGSDFPGDEHPAMVSLKTGKPVRNVTMGVYNPEDNSQRWILVNSVPLFRNGEERPYQVYATFLDITARRVMEDALRESEEKYRSLFESSKEGIVFTSIDGYIEEANPAYLEMLGYTLEELQNMAYTEFTPSKWAEMEREIVEEKVMKQGYADYYEKEYIRKDGTVFPVRLRVWLVTDDDGNPFRLFGIIIDITEEKKAENIRRQQQRELELYTSLLSHDISNDLQIILGNLSMVEGRHETIPEEMSDALNSMEAAAERIGRLLSVMGSPAEPESDLIRMLGNVTYRAKNIHKDLYIEISIPDFSGQFSIFSSRLLPMVFENILRNAAEHAGPNAEVKITVSKSDDDAEIIISDNGPGIPDSTKENLFVKSKSLSGRGIGLYLAKQILETIDGSIELLDTRDEEGTTFRITLPLSI